MNRRVAGIGVAFFLAVAVGAGMWARADDAPAGANTEPENKALEGDMGKMGKAFRKVSAQIKDPTQNAATLSLLSDMETACLAAKDEVPPMAADIATDKRAKFISDYRGSILGLLHQILDLEQLVIDGKNDKAADAITGIRDIMKEGHKDYRKPEN